MEKSVALFYFKNISKKFEKVYKNLLTSAKGCVIIGYTRKGKRKNEVKKMKAYAIDYSVKGQKYFGKLVDAKDLTSAKKKLGKKHGYKDGRMIKVDRVSVVGYF